MPDDRFGRNLGIAASSEDAPALMFQKVNRETLHDRVYLEIRRVIMSGRIRPGAMVTIRSLATALGTSTMPVRDALRRLLAERVLEVDSNRSYRLRSLTLSEFEEILHLRLMLEGAVAERAAERIANADVGTLERLQKSMEQALSTGGDFLDSNREFHFRFYMASDQPMTMGIIESLWLQAGPLLNYYRLRHGADTAMVHHRALLAALKSRDAKAARAAIESELTDAGKVILREIGQASVAED
jgi:DNA-binding GntR family transcriptional regulator